MNEETQKSGETYLQEIILLYLTKLEKLEKSERDCFTNAINLMTTPVITYTQNENNIR